MTVKELIEALTKFDEDATVYLVEDFYGYPGSEVMGVEVRETRWFHKDVEVEKLVTIV